MKERKYGLVSPYFLLYHLLFKIEIPSGMVVKGISKSPK